MVHWYESRIWFISWGKVHIAKMPNIPYSRYSRVWFTFMMIHSFIHKLFVHMIHMIVNDLLKWFIRTLIIYPNDLFVHKWFILSQTDHLSNLSDLLFFKWFILSWIVHLSDSFSHKWFVHISKMIHLVYITVKQNVPYRFILVYNMYSKF